MGSIKIGRVAGIAHHLQEFIGEWDGIGADRYIMGKRVMFIPLIVFIASQGFHVFDLEIELACRASRRASGNKDTLLEYNKFKNDVTACWSVSGETT